MDPAKSNPKGREFAAFPIVMVVAKGFQRPDIPRAKQEAKALMEAGFSIFVFAWDRYAEFPKVENVDGAVVRSFSLVNLRKFSRVGLALGGIVFQIAFNLELLRFINHVKKKPIINAHDINTLFPCCAFRVLRLASALVYDCREMTYGVYSEWFHPVLGAILRVIEEQLIGFADAVITVSDAIALYLRKFSQTVEVVYNCPRLLDIPRLPKKEVRRQLSLPEQAFIVSCVGTIRYDIRLDLMLEVASLLKNKGVFFLIVGEGPSTSEIIRGARGIPNLKIIPRVSRDMALRLILASDLTWAVYQNRPESLNPRMTLPWKLFESIACGVPVIVEANTFRAHMVKQLQLGIVLDDDSAEGISRVIVGLAKDHARYRKMSDAARNVSVTEYNWEEMSRKLDVLYKRIAAVKFRQFEIAAS